MAKSAEAFRTISEVADWLELETHVLRFWESKFPQIKPVRLSGGRRYYRPKDMLVLGGVKKLLREDGMTIKGVQNLIKKNGMRYITDLSRPLELGSEASTMLDSEGKVDAECHEISSQDQSESKREIDFSVKNILVDIGTTRDNVTSHSDLDDQIEVEEVDVKLPADEFFQYHEAQESSENLTNHSLNSKLNHSQTFASDNNEFDKRIALQEKNFPRESLSDTLFIGELLSNLSEIKVLTRRQTRELAPLIGRLAVLRDKLKNDQ
ncbi:MAG: MerR family transcriptional regulator [Aestuariivita sp.]|nr:MerR family transcriptional regulator [Aestuariivita sp.]